MAYGQFDTDRIDCPPIETHFLPGRQQIRLLAATDFNLCIDMQNRRPFRFFPLWRPTQIDSLLKAGNAN